VHILFKEQIMRKFILPLLLVLMALASACGGTASQAPTSQPNAQRHHGLGVPTRALVGLVGRTVVSRPTPGPKEFFRRLPQRLGQHSGEIPLSIQRLSGYPQPLLRDGATPEEYNDLLRLPSLP
jgi:hypothetical protein